jgi:hypothetical protein
MIHLDTKGPHIGRILYSISATFLDNPKHERFTAFNIQGSTVADVLCTKAMYLYCDGSSLYRTSQRKVEEHRSTVLYSVYTRQPI